MRRIHVIASCCDEMAKCVLFQAALLLHFIAGGHSQTPVPPSPTPTVLPSCGTLIASCMADAACSRLYAAFEENCKQELASMPANCTEQCMGAILSLGHPLGFSTLLCDCGSSSLAAAACRASQVNLQANCFPAPPPGML